MPANFNQIVEVFERISLDDSVYFLLRSEEGFNVCIYYIKKDNKKSWSIWYKDHETNSKQTISSLHLKSVLQGFKLDEKDFLSELSNVLLLQASFADEFIRQVSELLGKEAVQKSIFDTQSFMNELEKAVKSIVKSPVDESDKKEENRSRFKIIK